MTEPTREILETGRARYLTAQVREDAPGKVADSTEFLLSEPIEDRYRTIVDPSWELDHYRKNPVVLWMHDRFGLPVGTGTEIRVENERLLGRAVWAKDTEMGMALAKAYGTGLLRAASVSWTSGRIVARNSFDPSHKYYKKDAEWYEVVYFDNELREFSAVTIPGLQTALATGRAYHEHAEGLARAALGSDLAGALAELGLAPRTEHTPAPSEGLAEEDFWRVCAEAGESDWRWLTEAVAGLGT